MYVSINSNNEIKEVGISTNPDLTPVEINDEENPFKGWSTFKICCYRVEVRNGRVDMMTPYVDSRSLDAIEILGHKLDEMQAQIDELSAKLAKRRKPKTEVEE